MGRLAPAEQVLQLGVLWMVIAVVALAALLAVQGARAPGGASAAVWIRGVALLLLLLVTLRFGFRLLPLAGPLALWLIWGLRSVSQAGPGPEQTGGGNRRRMSREDAWRVLGVEESASAEQIQAAHRQLIKKLHPDQGGSSFLAQQVNEAKQVLLGR